MQKILLSLVVMANCCLIGAERNFSAQGTQEFIDKKARHEQLQSEIDALHEKVAQKEEEKDAIELSVYRDHQHDEYRQCLVAELEGKKGSIVKFHEASRKVAQMNNQNRKKADNGIEAGWIYGLTDPAEGSRAAKQYAHADDIEKNTNKVDHNLFAQDTGYVTPVESDILPALKNELERKLKLINELYIPGFAQCDCYEGPEYYSCLGDEGINEAQVSEKFVDKFARKAFISADKKVVERNIPLTQKELIRIAQNNPITKETVARMQAAQEQLKKAIRREKESTEKSPKEISDPSSKEVQPENQE